MARRELDIALALWALIGAAILGLGSLLPWRMGGAWQSGALALDAAAALLLAGAGWLLARLPPRETARPGRQTFK